MPTGGALHQCPPVFRYEVGMDRVPIVILAGGAGSGKDTVGEHLHARYGAVVIAQADPLKRFVRDVFGFSEQQLWGPSQLRNEPDPAFQRRNPWRSAMLDISRGL